MEFLTWMVGGILALNVIRLFLALGQRGFVKRENDKAVAELKADADRRWEELMGTPEDE